MGFLDKNVTPAKTYISTQWAWNLPVYFLISSPISLLSICPHLPAPFSGLGLLPVQRVIRTFLAKRLLRLVQPFPRSCMDKQNRMHTKMHTKYERRSASLAIAGFANIVPRVRIPLPPPNISNLTLKNMHTNAYNSFECIPNAYK